MTVVDDDWSEVVGNLQRGRKIWGQLSWILSREGADLKVSGHFFLSDDAGGVVVQGGDVGANT